MAKAIVKIGFKLYFLSNRPIATLVGETGGMQLNLRFHNDLDYTAKDTFSMLLNVWKRVQGRAISCAEKSLIKRMKHAQNRRRRPGTIEEMRPVCQWSENQDGELAPTGSLYNRYILRPISIYVTWLFVAIGIRAHTATFMMTTAGLAGIIFCVPHGMALTLVGGIFYLLFDLLDAVDGEIARWNKTSSTKGLFLDQVSHVFVDFPSLAVPALHYSLWKQDGVYIVLAVAALTSSLMARAFREIFMRINAEAAAGQELNQTCESAVPATFLQSLCKRLRESPLAMFPIVKPRVVHIVTWVAIFAAYAGFDGCLIFVSWFYAIYCTTRMLVEIPYYFSMRLVDVAHKKKGEKNNFPI